MVLRAPGPIIRSGFPRAGSLLADQQRDAFEAKFLDICGDTRLLYLPRGTETTTSTDRSRNARTFTYDATVAARYATLGSGVSVDYDGSANEADVPDAGNLSFGDGAVDQPFSVVVLANVDDTAALQMLLSKYDITTGSTKKEWRLQVDSLDRLAFYLEDDSASALIGRVDSAGTVQGSWALFVATYDGSAASTGIRLYQNGALVDDADDNSGSYVAMENTASLVRLGFSQGAAAGANFFNGRMALAALVAKEISQDANWAIKSLVNSFFDLEL